MNLIIKKITNSINKLLTGAFVVIEVISGNKKSKKQLIESGKQYKELIENLPDAVYTCDTEGYIKLYNKAAVKLWGKTPVVGKDVWPLSWKIFTKDGLPLDTNDAPLSTTLKSGKAVYGTEIIIQRPDGKQFNILYSSNPLFNGEGGLSGAVNFLVDITQKKEQDILNVKIEENYNDLIDQASDAIFINNPNGNLLEVNNSASALLGYSKEELIKMDVKDLYSETELSARPIMYKELFSGERTRLERLIKHKSGTSIPVEVTAKTLSDGRIMAIIRDISERKQIEEEIAENKKKLELMYNNIQDVVFLLSVNNKHFSFISVNNSFLHVTGLKEEQVIGKNVNEIIPEPSLSLVLEKYQEAITTRQSIQWEERTEYPSGAKTGIVSVTPLFNEEGICTMLVGTVHDITYRKKAEEEVALAFKEKQTLLNRISDKMVSVDQEWRYTYLNDAALTEHPLGREATLGKVIWDVHPEMIGTAFWDNYHEAMNTKKALEIESYYPPFNIWFYVKIYPSENGLTLFYNDITKRKQAEEKTRKVLERYDILSQATSDTIWDWNIINDTMLYNDGIKNMFGYNLSEIENLVDWWKQNIHRDDLPVVTESIDLAFQNKTEYLQLEYRFLCADGSYKYIFDRAFLLFDENTKPYRMIGAMQDITYNKQEEIRISKAIMDAQEQERRYIGEELHDNVNQILATALLTLSMVKEKPGYENRSLEYVDYTMDFIRNAIDETRKLSHQLAPAAFEDHSLRNVFETLLFTININERYKINFHFDESKEIQIPEDIQVNLYRILQEQTKNILKYSEADTIEITVTQTPGYVSMRIYDNGKGFDTHTAKKGIGLSNIKKRAESLSGKYRLNTAPGKGCELIVEIPF